MKIRALLTSATCLVLPVLAHAQPVTGPYISLGAGTSISNPLNYNYTAPTAGGQQSVFQGPSGRFLSKVSYAGVVGVGYGFGDGFRVELGGNYYRNTIHKDNQNAESFNGYGGPY